MIYKNAAAMADLFRLLCRFKILSREDTDALIDDLTVRVLQGEMKSHSVSKEDLTLPVRDLEDESC